MKINFPAEQLVINTNINNNSTSKSGNLSFTDFLNNAIKDVNNLQIESEQLNQAFAMGLNDNLHQVMIASEKADIALQFTVQIRNKILEAYQEIMRMNV
ncbi:MAG TPA: flagellar hook-basal body complex protein FliE [Bacillota bacterium]|jgi:flagellar hook-basal body complex protein FliE|nr:flagellar hook-basal body complex protein FliE [Bacillota bacterium]HRS21074.1 flagellar hook-basal body complex protein FliE [Clostridia bacterium]HRU40507.1 flagellar hook-basal body complex protein FliE [Candidatus Diapherotrites archaeon]HQE65464.1 flagellar hook-basal body complex protein FliE [Bacillota bacterium]HQI16699.1 flagellar hook-basal body complex protein FliE [Bacillota bacterium]